MSKPRGKYADVLPKLEKTFGNDASYQEKVDALKAELIANHGEAFTASRLASKFTALRAQKEALEQKEKELNLYIEAYSQLMAEAYEAEGVYSLTVDDGTVRMQPEPYPTVKDQDAVREWAAQNGYGRRLQLPWKTLESIVKQRLVDGQPDIPGVKTFNKTKFVFTKA